MALDGGGGGGGLLGVGNAFTGAASQLEIVGDFAYGYSGRVQAFSGNDGVAFDFTSGNYLFVGRFMVPFDKTGLGAGDSVGYTIKFNGATIARAETEHSTGIPQQKLWLDLIIPAYTEVEIIFDSDDTSEAFFLTGVLTGRIYR